MTVIPSVENEWLVKLNDRLCIKLEEVELKVHLQAEEINQLKEQLQEMKTLYPFPPFHLSPSKKK